MRNWRPASGRSEVSRPEQLVPRSIVRSTDMLDVPIHTPSLSLDGTLDHQDPVTCFCCCPWSWSSLHLRIRPARVSKPGVSGRNPWGTRSRKEERPWGIKRKRKKEHQRSKPGGKGEDQPEKGGGLVRSCLERAFWVLKTTGRWLCCPCRDQPWS